MKKFRIILWILLAVVVLIQFVRPAENRSVQADRGDITTMYTMPDSVHTILKNACYDCHSNSTHYPWYAQVQPFGWWLAMHIRDGKKELNFSEYASYSTKRQRSKLKSIKKQIDKGEMPLWSYTLAHPKARLTAAQKKAIINWTDSVL
ncbi:MAG TPA: heme-binding domain-containing protein [Chitinophaga sp.]|uniref:heme-binding domain-containing protein n=1 Tax=Chitinophaga sp. TaxID=1869181 RepID=UPI002BD15497|nr:heme-binding domain-containing protein [Chitinophaga sp.]HVI48753.1 heme-binding domain-containing protein [Chitinophaga sp.]